MEVLLLEAVKYNMSSKDSSMPGRMRAVVNCGPRDFRFTEECAIPEKPEGGVLLKVRG